MPCFNITARSLGVFCLLAPQALLAQAQQGSGSPYSAYGLGELSGTGQVSQAMMGGLGVAVVDPVSVTYTNPASYAFLQRTTFEQGLVVRSSKYSSSGTESNGRQVGLLGLTLGVPFGNGKWGMALGLAPMSTVGYNISTTSQPSDVAGVRYQYTGDGGLNRAFLGMGRTLLEKRDSLYNGHRLSVGANLGYVFGRIEESRKVYYPSGLGYYNSSIFSSLVVRDPVANLGIQFQGDLRKRRTSDDRATHFLVGAAFELPANLSAQRTDLVNTFAQSSSGVEFPIDTSFIAIGSKGSVGLPLGIGLGLTVFNLHWTVSAEVKQRDWRKLTVSVEDYTLPSQLASSTSYMLGASFRPAGERGGTFWERTTYRAGARFNDDYLVVDGHQLQEIGMSFGLSLPVMGSITRSRLNLGAELGERGTTSDGLLRERYAAWFIGLTITPDIRENWFKKRRIE
ncbi:MAG: hypothetical protein IPH05_18265 [Flavobacteriales bacterium]|nr:hypothetical protein [Flavobacteriales bacterium]MBK6884841.1 hypothetical protein [Flavobacteriales bacterium]MBK7112632.1 hypothetical protein [Flavobacteriales bacterium]MBK8531442.1 hypothetical protein [Flavobacteriales bacterium]MBK9627590.1 hypothetical protein [Flavobacteriales bacterium]